MTMDVQLFGHENIDLHDVFRPPDMYIHLKPDTPIGGLTGAGMIAAVIDTGILPEHPDIAPRLIDFLDVTGRGAMDEAGHGTLVTLLLLKTAPDTQILSVKAKQGRDGAGGAAELIKAFQLVAERQDVALVNVSLGRFTPGCDGDCDICVAGTRLVESGKIVLAAAGNLPNSTSCPAKAAAVIAVAAIDPATNELTDYSGNSKDGISMFEARAIATWISASTSP
ncbi:S8 family serine peptidase [Arthrobacter sp. B0490]|uniref:S8 family serine peptidase n=1 Tax=Arthrobacter sp. B0490 TaxID=2058891 RepID=UPI000CE57A62|nr:S8 family serine peptidase [Arthrobacter sp. B0490]